MSLSIDANDPEINAAIAKNDWQAAKKLIRAALRKDDANHWLWVHLGLAYLELGSYKVAQVCIDKACERCQFCPLVHWYSACVLEAQGNRWNAMAKWKRLLKRRLDVVAYGKCGEGMNHAKGLFNDCRFRIALVYRDLSLTEPNQSIKQCKVYMRSAIRWMRLHLQNRAPGVPSLYTIEEGRARLNDMCKKMSMLGMVKT